MQLTLDSFEADSRKHAGLNAIETTDSKFVGAIRQTAIELSNKSGFVSSDDLRVWADQHGLKPMHPNSWGSIFRGPCWKIVGRKKSALPSTHGREIKIWRYEPA